MRDRPLAHRANAGDVNRACSASACASNAGSTLSAESGAPSAATKRAAHSSRIAASADARSQASISTASSRRSSVVSDLAVHGQPLQQPGIGQPPCATCGIRGSGLIGVDADQSLHRPEFMMAARSDVPQRAHGCIRIQPILLQQGSDLRQRATYRHDESCVREDAPQITHAQGVVVALADITLRAACANEFGQMRTEQALEARVRRLRIDEIGFRRGIVRKEVRPDRFLERFRTVARDTDAVAVRALHGLDPGGRKPRQQPVPPVRRPQHRKIGIPVCGESGHRVQPFQQHGRAAAGETGDEHRTVRRRQLALGRDNAGLDIGQPWPQGGKSPLPPFSETVRPGNPPRVFVAALAHGQCSEARALNAFNRASSRRCFQSSSAATRPTTSGSRPIATSRAANACSARPCTASRQARL